MVPIFYGKDTLVMDEVRAALNSKELQRKSYGKEFNGDNLYVRERSEKRNTKKGRGKSRSKSRIFRKCFKCHKQEGYKQEGGTWRCISCHR